jgi:hypothetical protein
MTPPCPDAIPHLTVDAPGYTGPERRKTETEWRSAVERRFAEGSQTMAAMRDELRTNTQATAATQEIAQATQARVEEMLDFFESMKGAWKFFDLLGRLAKPVGAIAMAGAAVYSLWSAVKGHK